MTTTRTTALIAAACLGVAGCGGAAKPKQQHDPVACLKGAGLESVEKRDTGLWRGYASDRTIVLVERMASKREAQDDAAAADLVWAYPVGRYFVHGPCKSTDGRATQAVANCLNARPQEVS